MLFGWIVKYQGREYRLGRQGDDWVNVVSNDEQDLERGFSPYLPGVFVKKVERKQVEGIYHIRHYGVIHGHRVEFINAKEGRLLAISMGAVPGFDEADRGVWQRWLSPNELERIWEERTPKD